MDLKQNPYWSDEDNCNSRMAISGSNMTSIADPSFIQSTDSQCQYSNLHGHGQSCSFCGGAESSGHGQRFNDLSSTHLQTAGGTSQYLVGGAGHATWWPPRQSMPGYSPSQFGHLNTGETLPLSSSDSQSVAGSQLQISSGTSSSQGHNNTSTTSSEYLSFGHESYPFQYSYAMGDLGPVASPRDDKRGMKSSPDSPSSERSVSEGTASPETSHAIPQVIRQEYGPHRGARDNRQITFPTSKTLMNLKCNSEIITPEIHARMDKNLMWVDNQWTCYRRNYITIHTHYTLKPNIASACLYVEMKGGERQVQALGVSLSASMDEPQGKPIGLIQHTAKRDRGPQCDVGIRKLSPTLPSAQFPPYHGSTSTNGPYLPMQAEDEQRNSSLTPTGSHTFERIQFKQATANNGKRRAQQQFYHIMVELYANIQKANEKEPNWVKVAQKTSEAMVVRGRSPGHYKDSPSTSGASSGNAGGGSGQSYGVANRSHVQSFASLSSSGRNDMGGTGGSSYRANQCLPSPHASLLAPPSHSFSVPPRKHHELPLPAMGEHGTYHAFSGGDHSRYYQPSQYGPSLRYSQPTTLKPEGLYGSSQPLVASCGQEEAPLGSTIGPLWTMTTCNRIPDFKGGFADLSATH